MIAAVIFSRRNTCAKDLVTVEVPAPEEPVIAMMGCLTDMIVSERKEMGSAEQGA